MLPPPTLGRVLLPLLLPLLLPPTLGRALPLLPLPLLPLLVEIVLLTLLVLGRTALRLPALLVMVPVLPVERFTELLPVERFTVLLLPLLRLMVLLLLPPTLGRMLEALLLVLGEVDTALLVEGRALTLLIEERAELLLLLTAALFFGETVATLRLPAAAALLVAAGRRPCAIAPVDVMASPHASIKPIIVL